MQHDADLIGHIYEAAAMPELWPEVLDRMAALVGALGGDLIVANERFTGWTASASLVQPMRETIQSGWGSRNPRVPRALARDSPGILRDQDLFTPDEIESDPFYQFLRRIGLGWVVGTVIKPPNGDLIVFSLERSQAAGQFTAAEAGILESLRPHIARAALLAERFALTRARSSVDALAAIGLPAAILSLSFRVIAANDLMDVHIPKTIQDRKQGISLSDPRADTLLAKSIHAIGSGALHDIRSIPIRSAAGDPISVAHLIPIWSTARELFSSASCILVITPFAARKSLPLDVIHGLFDLTPAEARVAQGIGDGKTIQEIAGLAGTSPGTVRQQLKSVFAKTGATRQAELIHFLTGHTFGLQADPRPSLP